MRNMKTEINILEGNKLIAEFMEMTTVTKYRHYDTGRLVNYSYKLDAEYNIDPNFPIIVYKDKKNTIFEELCYYSSWDWLMPVVIKINTMDDFEFSTTIFTMDCNIQNKSGYIISNCECVYNPDELIKSVWSVVVEFINWYNSK